MIVAHDKSCHANVGGSCLHLLGCREATEEELAADAVDRLRRKRHRWRDGHVSEVSPGAVAHMENVITCDDCGDVLKNRFGACSPARACPGRAGA